MVVLAFLGVTLAWALVSTIWALVERRERKEWANVACILGDEYDKLVVEVVQRKHGATVVEQRTRWLN